MKGDSNESDPAVTPHIWVGGYSLGRIPADEFADNILAFAKRHDLTIVISQWTTSEADAQPLEERLRLAKEWGVDAWLGTYDLREYSDTELVADETKMEADLERLHRMVDIYADYYPDGKVFVWHEPPNTGQWTGETRTEQAQSMVENGPEIFSRQKASVAEQHPDLDFGLMLWWPTAAPPGHTTTPVCEPLMTRLAEQDALPDFTYIDVYRYHFEWDVGHEAVNEHITATLENIKEHTDDRPVYFLADLHSYPEIGGPSKFDDFPEGNNAYTPSKQALLGHLRSAFDVGVESFGWYIGKHYRAATHPRNYEPFIPNVGTVDDQRNFNSVTGSRDRFIWATQALCETAGTFDPANKFDLWISGHNLNFYEHAVELQTADGTWEFLGDVSGYVDGANPYSGGERDRVVAFHALARDRYLADGSLSIRLSSHSDGNGATLHSVYAVPYLDAGHYQTEPELTDLVDELPDLNDVILGSVTPDAELSPNAEADIDLAVTEPTADISQLIQPVQREARAELSQLEDDSAFNPRDYFDLWVYGDSLKDTSIELSGTNINEYGGPLDDRSEDCSARVYRGLERSQFFERHTGGHYLDMNMIGDTPATVRATFVMPYHGTMNFTSDSEAVSIIERDYTLGEGEGMLTTFALGHQYWPDGAKLGTGDRLETWVQMPHRQVRPGSD